MIEKGRLWDLAASARVVDDSFVQIVDRPSDIAEGYAPGSVARAELVKSSPALRDVLLAVADACGDALPDDEALAAAALAPEVPWTLHDIGERKRTASRFRPLSRLPQG